MLNDDLNCEQELIKDIDRFFETSFSKQYSIFYDYTNYLSQEIQDNFKKFLSYFKDNWYDIEYLFNVGLGNDLRKYVDKYLSLSKRTDGEFIERGSTALCYRIGDYAFKLSHRKWSYEEEICPNLYIILKNLEEHFIRNKQRIVIAGLEVQKYLTRSINEYPVNIRKEILEFLESELDRLGYYTTDTLIGGRCGDNCKILDTYKDADTLNLKRIPPFFKKYPAVFIDRDRFYKKDNIYPKQIYERWCD